jgi:integrase
MEYIALVENLGIESEYLFPQEYFKITHKNSVTDYQRYSNRQFTYLLISFYEEVVKKGYKISEIERIKPGDTRHFAIINMFLMGFNMLTIARMAGHTRIEEPAHYYTHIPELLLYNFLKSSRRG